MAQNLLTGELVAIKFIPLGPRFYVRYVERETINHRRLTHPHIVAFKEVMLTSRHLGIVMEYVGGGNLQSFVERRGPLPEALARCFFQQLVLALRHCHARLGIAHRDIKLGNLLLDDRFAVPILKICDFGYSKALAPHSAPKTRVGTAAYCAPEVAASAGDRPYDVEKADVWSAGVTLYCMLLGRYPFVDDKHRARLRAIANLSDADVDVACSPLDVEAPGAAALLRKILRVDPKQRAGFAQVVEDPWFLTLLPDTSRMEADAEAEAAAAESAGGAQAEAEIRAALAAADALSKRIAAAEENKDIDDVLDDIDDEGLEQLAQR